MKRHLTSLLMAIMAITLWASCGKTNSNSDTTSNIPKADLSLRVSLSKGQIAADGAEQVTITVTDQNNTDVTSTSVIYVNGTAISKNVFSTTTPGSYQVSAKKGAASSAVVNLIAASATSSVFTQKVLGEFFTGTWCGICPGVLIPLEDYTRANPNAIVVGIHGPNGSGDPFTFVYDAQLRTTFGISGVPTVLLNRNTYWDNNNATLDQLQRNTALLGIGLQTSLSGNTISVTTKVKFGTDITAPLKMVVMLAEDSLAYNQTNYGHFNLPNPIVNYEHRNVVRSTATDVFGDPIPAAQQTKDNIWQRSFTIDASQYNINHCRIVAFVLYDTNNQNLKGVLNTQIVTAGKTITY